MVRFAPRFTLTLATIAVLFGACGDDDDPVPGDSRATTRTPAVSTFD
ncbi:MAG: hypothetical protein L0Z51_08220 [Candidatus Latescibacteria bacterium]|nr:hypothetical protein [Candidatus Latescibacterota bacterium]